MKTISNRHVCGAARLAAAFSLLALLSCAGQSVDLRIIDGILQERASHLTDGDRRKIGGALVRAERRTGVHALLLLSLMEEESDYKSRAKGRRGALGLLQVRPATGRAVAKRHQISWTGQESLFDPTVNVLIGATYLREMKLRFGSWDLALTAYNRGPSKTAKIARHDRVPSSRYAGRVLQRFEALRARSAG